MEQPEQTFPRATLEYTCNVRRCCVAEAASVADKQLQDARFIVSPKLSHGQFAQLYYQRLMMATPLLRAAAKQRWPALPGAGCCFVPPPPLTRASSSQSVGPGGGPGVRAAGHAVQGHEVEAVHPGRLRSRRASAVRQPVRASRAPQLSLPRAVGAHAKFVSADDSLVLEDEGARVKLRGLAPAPLASGVVLAVRGRTNGLEFVVEEACFATPTAQAPLAPPPAGAEAQAGPYVALLSGLSLGGAADPLAATLAVDWLSGHLGGWREAGLASRVVRAIVAGNTVATTPPPPGGAGAIHAAEARVAASKLAGPLREADVLLAQLAAALPVDLMPGRSDPAMVALPQQPMHPCLLPFSGRFVAAFSRVTNPHECALGGVVILGTSGQNIDDLWRCTEGDDRLALLERTLEWGHLAPTAPDSLSCRPLADRDPFLMPTAPHVLFAANQPAFASKLVVSDDGRGGTATTRLVLVPRFADTGTIVLVNLATLGVHPVTFETSALVERKEEGVE